MDKQEYREIVSDIRRAHDNQEYDKVLMYADELDMRKVSDSRVLEMISDAYAVSGDLESAQELLLKAYEKTPMGRKLAYKLSEISIRLGDLDGAVDFYEDFCKMAPHDNDRYLLKYKIGRAGRVPKKDLIKVLASYCDKEVDERWMAELATLYDEVGDKEKCGEVCDDIILWFADGIYVQKALELKRKNGGLTPAQETKLEQLKAQQEEEAQAKQEAKAAKIQNVQMDDFEEERELHPGDIEPDSLKAEELDSILEEYITVEDATAPPQPPRAEDMADAMAELDDDIDYVDITEPETEVIPIHEIRAAADLAEDAQANIDEAKEEARKAAALEAQLSGLGNEIVENESLMQELELKTAPVHEEVQDIIAENMGKAEPEEIPDVLSGSLAKLKKAQEEAPVEEELQPAEEEFVPAAEEVPAQEKVAAEPETFAEEIQEEVYEEPEELPAEDMIEELTAQIFTDEIAAAIAPEEFTPQEEAVFEAAPAQKPEPIVEEEPVEETAEEPEAAPAATIRFEPVREPEVDEPTRIVIPAPPTGDYIPAVEVAMAEEDYVEEPVIEETIMEAEQEMEQEAEPEPEAAPEPVYGRPFFSNIQATQSARTAPPKTEADFWKMPANLTFDEDAPAEEFAEPVYGSHRWFEEKSDPSLGYTEPIFGSHRYVPPTEVEPEPVYEEEEAEPMDVVIEQVEPEPIVIEPAEEEEPMPQHVSTIHTTSSGMELLGLYAAAKKPQGAGLADQASLVRKPALGGRKPLPPELFADPVAEPEYYEGPAFVDYANEEPEKEATEEIPAAETGLTEGPSLVAEDLEIIEKSVQEFEEEPKEEEAPAEEIVEETVEEAEEPEAVAEETTEEEAAEEPAEEEAKEEPAAEEPVEEVKEEPVEEAPAEEEVKEEPVEEEAKEEPQEEPAEEVKEKAEETPAEEEEDVPHAEIVEKVKSTPEEKEIPVFMKPEDYVDEPTGFIRAIKAFEKGTADGTVETYDTTYIPKVDDLLKEFDAEKEEEAAPEKYEPSIKLEDEAMGHVTQYIPAAEVKEQIEIEERIEEAPELREDEEEDIDFAGSELVAELFDEEPAERAPKHVDEEGFETDRWDEEPEEEVIEEPEEKPEPEVVFLHDETETEAEKEVIPELAANVSALMEEDAKTEPEEVVTEEPASQEETEEPEEIVPEEAPEEEVISEPVAEEIVEAPAEETIEETEEIEEVIEEPEEVIDEEEEEEEEEDEEPIGPPPFMFSVMPHTFVEEVVPDVVKENIARAKAAKEAAEKPAQEPEVLPEQTEPAEAAEAVEAVAAEPEATYEKEVLDFEEAKTEEPPEAEGADSEADNTEPEAEPSVFIPLKHLTDEGEKAPVEEAVEEVAEEAAEPDTAAAALFAEVPAGGVIAEEPVVPETVEDVPAFEEPAVFDETDENLGFDRAVQDMELSSHEVEDADWDDEYGVAEPLVDEAPIIEITASLPKIEEEVPVVPEVPVEEPTEELTDFERAMRAFDEGSAPVEEDFTEGEFDEAMDELMDEAVEPWEEPEFGLPDFEGSEFEQPAYLGNDFDSEERYVPEEIIEEEEEKEVEELSGFEKALAEFERENREAQIVPLAEEPEYENEYADYPEMPEPEVPVYEEPAYEEPVYEEPQLADPAFVETVPAVKRAPAAKTGYAIPEDLREELSEFLLIDGMEDRISTTIGSIIERRRGGDPTGGHLLVTGDAKSGKTYLTIAIIKAVGKEIGSSTGRVAKVKAESLNGKDMNKVFAKIAGSDLIIENAGYLNDQTIGYLIDAMKSGKYSSMVVLEGNKLGIENILTKNPGLAELFHTRLNLDELSLSQWADLACAYAEEKGYKVGDMALLALHARIDEMNLPTTRLVVEDVQGIIDKAIEKANKRSSGRFLGRRKGREGVQELDESDFM